MHVGLPSMSEGGRFDDIPVNLETGLLSVVRKIINLLPDSQVRKVIGPILDQESIVVMANNPSILIRTAVVRVSHSLYSSQVTLARTSIGILIWELHTVHCTCVSVE